MKMLMQITDEELQELNVEMGVLETTFDVIGISVVIWEMVKEAGKATYKDRGY